ncbi:RNA polymerase sigma factor, sigma-70 family [Xenococcus sp. PCC 7305]|uniref:sigma-70 family RNA polymerase sigma factor n=1 Tax=Xenococcus sp. PCC 7305 TaxID=102125 RepID=UPI0002AC97C4|nr:sigma-70 family RNA polymerase sigma factor [Xenococcus sp. PCC 7305]ELS01349.1 RNA polymerase sigma factor, sigma-70 family [Xenococcus sp. PCC 7305]
MIKTERDLFQVNNTEGEQTTDEAIFADFIRGDSAALGILYDRYGLLVYRLIYRMLKNNSEAEDLTQEIFLTLQEKPNYNPQRGSFYTYLMMLTRSRTIDKIRSKKSQGNLLHNLGKIKDLIGKENKANPIDIASTEEREIQVKNALQYLSDNQRKILELSYYEGLSQSEISEILEIPLGTVKTHSRRGLIILRKNLQNLIT